MFLIMKISKRINWKLAAEASGATVIETISKNLNLME